MFLKQNYSDSELVCPHDECVGRNEFYKNLRQHFLSQHNSEEIDIKAARKHTFEVQGMLMERKILLASGSMVSL